MQVEIQFLPWLGERLGGPSYSSRTLKWQVEAAQGEAVGALFTRLATDQAFGRLIFDPEQQRLHEVVAVVLNGRLLDLSGGLQRPLADGDRLAIMPAIAGGAAHRSSEGCRGHGRAGTPVSRRSNARRR